MGSCPCKAVVTGLCCHQCEPHRLNVTMGIFKGARCVSATPWGQYLGAFVTPSVASAYVGLIGKEEGVSSISQVGDQLLFSA